MATYTETININVNDAGVTRASSSLRTLKSSINAINNTPITIKFKGANDFSKVINSYKNMIKTLNSGDTQGINKALEQLNKLQSVANKQIKINIKEDNIKSIVSSIEKLTTEMKELKSVAKSIDLSGISKNSGSTKQINSQLQQINTTLKQIKSNSNIQIKISQSGVTAGGLQQTATGVQRTASRVNGHNHTGNYFGFYADDSPLYQYGSALKQTTRRMQMASEKINLIGANLATFASYAGVKEMTDILIETPAKADVQRYLLSEMQGDQTSHDIKNVTGVGAGAEASLYSILDKQTDKLPISMQNVVQPLYAWNSANQTTADDLAYAIPSMANFGAQVLNMTGSEERAQTAMEKLSYAFNGQFAAVDQFGISERSLEKHGFKKEWQGDLEHVRDFFDAVDDITGDATKSMHNFNGMKATVGKDFSRSGKKIWNNLLEPIATTGLTAFHEFDAGLGGIPTQLIAVGSAGLSVATSLTMLLGSAGTAVGAFSEAIASFRVMRKNGGGLKEFFKVFSASSFNELNRYGYGGNYGKLYGAGGGMMIPPEMAMMYGADVDFAPTDKDGNPLPTVADPKKTGAKAEHKAYARDINKQRKKELDAIKKSTKNRIEEARQSFKANRKYNSMIKNHAKSLKLTTSRLDGLKSSLGSIGTFGKASIVLAGLYLGYKVIQSAWSEAYNRNENVKAATDRMTTAWDSLSSKISGGLGDIIGNTLYHGETQGSGTFDKIFEDIANNTAAILERLGGTTPQQQEDAKKPESEQYGWNEGDTDALKQTKKDAIEHVKWWSNLKMANAHFWDGIFGTHAEKKVLAEREDTISAIRSGDISAGSNYTTLGRGKIQLGLGAALTRRDFINELFDKEKSISGTDWRDSGGSQKEMYQRYLRNKVLGIPDEDKVLDPRTAKDWVDFRNEWSGGKNYKNPITHKSANDELMEKYNTKRNERANEPSTADKLMDMHTATAIKRNLENNPKPPVGLEKITAWWNNTFGGGTRTNTTVQANNVELQNKNNGSNLVGDSLRAIFGTGGLGILAGGLNPVSAASTGGADAEQQALRQATAGTGTGAMDISQQVSQMYQQANLTSQTESTTLATNMQTNLSTALATMDFTPVGSQLATSLNQSVQTSLSTAPIDLSGFFSNITSQLSSHNAEFNSAGNEGGNQYTSGFSSGVGGASGAASSEAGEILSALDISAEAYALGQAAGNAYQEGYRSSGGGDMHSPGKAARAARDEGLYILGFMRDSVSPIYSSAQQMGRSMANGFARTGTLGYNGVSFPSVNKENTAGFVMGNTGTTGGATYNTLNFNIEKIDSRDRAKEVAEFATQMLKWNNETAGRTTEV